LLRKHWQVLGVDLNRSELVQEKPPNARAARWSAWLLLIGPGGGSEKLDGAISGARRRRGIAMWLESGFGPKDLPLETCGRKAQAQRR
jgi:hypothetical protein